MDNERKTGPRVKNTHKEHLEEMENFLHFLNLTMYFICSVFGYLMRFVWAATSATGASLNL